MTSSNDIFIFGFFKGFIVFPRSQTKLCQVWCRSKNGFQIYGFKFNFRYFIVKKFFFKQLIFQFYKLIARSSNAERYQHGNLLNFNILTSGTTSNHKKIMHYECQGPGL